VRLTQNGSTWEGLNLALKDDNGFYLNGAVTVRAAFCRVVEHLVNDQLSMIYKIYLCHNLREYLDTSWWFFWGGRDL
jgi:hypothetical protein